MAPSKNFLSRLLGSSNTAGDVTAKQPKPPNPLQAIGSIMYRLHSLEPLGVEHELPQTLLQALTARLKFGMHVTQRTARVLVTLLLRTCVRHPLGWTIPQEVVCMLMYGILQSRQVPAWRAFFSGVGDLQTWCPVVKEKVTTGSCESWWVRLPAEQRPQQPQATINWLFLHGGAFVAGDALMYTQTFMCWLQYLAQQGIEASILTVEYPLAPEHPFPAGLNAAADAIHWLLHDSRETGHYFVGGDSAGGNLALAALSLLRDGGKLSRPPLGVTLISPAVDLSNASVFGRREPVSSHFDQQQQQQQQQQHGNCKSHNKHKQSSSNSKQDVSCSSSRTVDHTESAQQQNQQEGPYPGLATDSSDSTGAGMAAEQQGVTPSPGVAQLLLGGSFRRRTKQQHQQHQQYQHQQGASLQSQGSVNVAQRQLEQQHVPLQSQPSTDCSMHAAHTAGGKLRPWHLLSGVTGELLTALRVHSSSSSAHEVAASGWFDYIPSDSFADELHCYLPDPQLLSHPLVSPTYAADVAGLCQAGMLVVAGGAELMRRDIQAFAAKAAAAAAAAAGGRGDAGNGGGGDASTTADRAAAAVQAPAAPTAAAAAAAVLRGSDGAADVAVDAAAQAEGSGTSAAAPPGDASCRNSARDSSSGGGVPGFRVVYHEEPGEPHVYAMLMLPHLLQKGLVVPRFVAAVVKGLPLEEVASGTTPA